MAKKDNDQNNVLHIQKEMELIQQNLDICMIDVYSVRHTVDL